MNTTTTNNLNARGFGRSFYSIGAFLPLTLLTVALLFPASAADITEPITLEIPQLQLQLEPNGAAVIASTEFDQLLIHVAKSPCK